MDFSLTADQQAIREAVLGICGQFSDDYWLERDADGEFPVEFSSAMAQAGWLGIAMPEACGGSGLGITEAAIMMQAVAEAGGGTIHAPSRARPASIMSSKPSGAGVPCEPWRVLM